MAKRSVGGDVLAPGGIDGRKYAPRGTDERHVDPPMVPRETFGWDQINGMEPAPVELGSSHNYPVRRGGNPRIIVTLTSAFTTAGELTLYRNDTSFAVLPLPTGTTFIEEMYSLVTLAPRDLARVEVTDEGAGGVGLLVAWWF